MTQLRSFIDRVLRLKEEQDALTSDIREVYAEAKSNGFDKTVMGQLVTYLRKRDKDRHKLEENGAIFDLYLHEYDRGTEVALARAHEPDRNKGRTWTNEGLTDKVSIEPHDPSTGELIEIHREPSNRDVSTDGEAYSAAASQGQAAHAGTGSETLASHEGDTQGEGASVLSPPNSLEHENPANKGLSGPEAGIPLEPIHSAPTLADQGLDSIGIPLPELLSSPATDLEIPAFLRRTA